MKLTFFTLLLLSTAFMLSSSTCTVLQSTLNIWMSVNETYEWELKKIIQGDNLTYSLSQNDTQFGIQKPISMIGNPNPHIEAIERIVGKRAYLENNQIIWMNSFVFIESQLGTLDLFYSVQAQFDSSPPSFENKINIPIENSYIQCFGVEYISFNLFILDCIDTKKLPFTNLFMLQYKSGGNPKIYENQNINQYSYISQRIIQAVNLINLFDESTTYIFRTTPSYAIQVGKLDTSSILEIFEIDNLNQPILLTYLDSKKMAGLLNISDPDNFKFSIIDFKVYSDNNIYILTSTDGIYIVKFVVDGQFELVSHIDFDIVDLALSFDIYYFQEYGQFYIVLYQNYFILTNSYGEILETTEFDFTAKYPDYVAISGDLLVIHSSGITHLFDPFSNEYQISQETLEGAKALFINPNYPEIITITQIDSRKYHLSQGFLKFKGKEIESATKILQLNATDSFGQLCSSKIYYQVLSSSNHSLIKTQNLVFPALQYDTPMPYLINLIASGPNQNFIKLETDELEININQLYETKLDYINIVSHQNIKFAQTMMHEDNYFALITQNNLNVTFINVCSFIGKDNVNANCEEFKYFTLPYNLNKQNFAWWFQSKYIIYHITLDNDFLATIRISTPTGILESFQISYKNLMQYKITSVTLIQSGFCFLLKIMSYIDIWSTTAPAQLNYRIDKYAFWDSRYYEKLSFNKVVGYQDKPYIFIINNNKDVIIGELINEFRILKVITFETGEIDLALGDNCFFIVYKSQSESFIQEYKINEFGIISFQKYLPLYDFIIKSPLQVEYTKSGTLLIEATKPSNNYTFILIYQSNEFYRDSLKKVIQLDNKNQCLIAASGMKQQIIYINYDGIYQAYSYWNQMLVTIKPQFQDNIQYINQNLSLQLQNKLPDWNINNLVYNSSIKLVNTYTEIKVNQTYLDYYPLIIEDVDIQKFEFQSNELFQGTVANLQVTCEQCYKLITPINTIQFINRKQLNILRIDNVQPYVNQTFLYLDSFHERVYILDEQDNLLAEYETGSRNTCKEISSAFDGEFIFTACKDKQAFIHVAQCKQTQTLQCLQYGDNLFLEDIKTVSNLVISGQYIFVGQQSNDIFLAIYKLINQGHGMQLELVKIFKTSEISLIDFNFQSFLLTTYNKNQQFKILVLGQNKYIFGIDAIIQNDQLLISDDFSIFNIELLLNSINNFFYSSYNFLQIEEAYSSIYDEQNQSLSVFVLIITNNNHYAIKLDFKETNEIYFLFTLSQYSNYKIERQVAVRGGYVANLYTKGLFSYQLIVYKLPLVPIQDQKIFYGIGGESFSNAKIVYIDTNIFNQNIVKVFSNFNDTMSYNINKEYGIQVDNSDGMLIEQEIKLTFSNNLNSETASIQLRKQELIETILI